MFNYQSYLKLRNAQAHLEAILASCLPWDAKYRLVFNDNCSGRLYAIAQEMQRAIDWLDLDADYEDDVRAFQRGVTDLVSALHQELMALDAAAAMSLFDSAYPAPSQ